MNADSDVQELSFWCIEPAWFLKEDAETESMWPRKYYFEVEVCILSVKKDTMKHVIQN